MIAILRADFLQPSGEKQFCTLTFAKDDHNILPLGHSGEYGNAAKLVGKMSKSVVQLISIHF